MKIEIRNHPAQARNPVTDEPLVDESGAPVPLFPEERAVYFEGRLVAYIGSPPRRALMFVTPKERLGSYVTNWIQQQVYAQTGHQVKVMTSVPLKEDAPIEDED